MNLIEYRDEQLRVLKRVDMHAQLFNEAVHEAARRRERLRDSVVRALGAGVPAADLAALCDVHVTTIYDWRRAAASS